MNKLCQNCRYGASVQHIGECGCPKKLQTDDVAEYISLCGFNVYNGRFINAPEVERFVEIMRKENPGHNEIARVVLPKAATAIGECAQYKPRIVAGRDLWELWKGGDR